MRIGVTFPQTEFGNDPGAIREYARAVEGLGFRHFLVYDHVLGADTTGRPGWTGPYTSETPFHEVFVLLAYVAAVTERLELVTGVLILPQRQTALVAKQAAEVDVLTGGRFRLGIGVGWNAVEYEALNEDFRTRGRRCEEQMAVLRALWTDPVVTFDGTYHRLTAVGLNPLPTQRPIPIWLGGDSEIAIERCGRLADGWIPHGRPDGELAARIARVHAHAAAAGRPPGTVGIEGRLSINEVPEDEWATEVERWRGLGVSHLGLNTMGAGLPTPEAHIAAIKRFAEAVGL